MVIKDKAYYVALGKYSAPMVREAMRKIKNNNICKYNENPKHCKYCSVTIPYHKRQNDFCSHSCSATYNNIGKVKNKQGNNGMGESHSLPRVNITTCTYCGEPLKRPKRKHIGEPAFCCNKHRSMYASELKMQQRGLMELSTLRYYLVNKRGYKCEVCGLTKWRNHPVPLDIHHIDGDAFNNKPENMVLCCKNCHGITDTYGSKNKGNITRYNEIKKRKNKLHP